jgi:DNA-binding MarR family transcriptional regulator
MAKEADQSPAETQERLERLARLIRSAGHAQGLIPAQWDVLRYLARANSFSNAPAAAAQYLGATKGTISQTILALVKKGLVQSVKRGGDQRSVALHLTAKGKECLALDPLVTLARNIENLGGKTQRRFSKAVGELLLAESERQDHATFGVCGDCRFLLHSKPPACASFGAVLNAETLHLLCYRFKPVKKS